MAGSLAATTETSMDAALEAVISELDGILALKEEQRTALKGFLGGKRCFPSTPDWLLQRGFFDKHQAALHLTTRQSSACLIWSLHQWQALNGCYVAKLAADLGYDLQCPPRLHAPPTYTQRVPSFFMCT